MHIGHGNMDEEYKMGDAVLGRTTQEKDLGGLLLRKEIILGLIRKTIQYKRNSYL